MPDGLYERDSLAWSERQADLLRRLAAGERLNEAVDWANVIEEIQGVGLGELHACEILLTKAMLLLLQLRAEPDSPDAPDWRYGTLVALMDAGLAFSPSMRQRINLQSLYDDAAHQASAGHEDADARPSVAGICPFTLDDLLADDPDLATLIERAGAA